jgi:DNA ligase (NAD+)
VIFGNVRVEEIMDKKMLTSRILELSEQVKYHADLYYNGSQPEITDAEYDEMVDLLKAYVADLEKIDAQAPELSVGKEALNDVGSMPSYGRKVQHSNVMGSLSKVTSVKEVKEWFAKYGKPGMKIAVTPKADGCAGRVNYHGDMTEAATRGDGNIGQDVTDNVRAIQSIPKSISLRSKIEVRGEVMMFRSVFRELAESGARVFANPRNAGSGSLMNQDPKVTGSRNLDFMVYDIFSSERFKTESEKRGWMVINLPEFKMVAMQVIDISQFEALALEWEAQRPSLDYEIDGLVIALDSIEAQEEAGWDGKRPRGKIAFKFRPEQVVTKCVERDYQVGRTGKLTPMARVAPVLLAGSTISNISLHNQANVIKLNIEAGDDILIEKAGDIIPQVVRVVSRPEDRIVEDVSKIVCPSCGGQVEMDENGVSLWCHNVVCPAQFERRVLHWIQTVSIMGVGAGIVSELCSQDFLKDISDLYYLTDQQLRCATGGESSANKAKLAILGKSEIALAVFLDALGIDGLGTTTSKDVAKKFQTLASVRIATPDEMYCIQGIGKLTAYKIVIGLHNLSGTIDKLLMAIDVLDQVQKQGNLTGMSFVLKGSMSKPRKEIEEAIEKAGGENKGSVGKGVTYLVQADPSSTSGKTEKANKCGTKIISEDALWAMIEG